MNDYSDQETTSHDYTVDLEASAWNSPSGAVVGTVAELSNREIEHLDPLYRRVNPDALDSVFGHRNNTSAGCRVCFRYEGYQIELIGSHELRLTPVEELVVN